MRTGETIIKDGARLEALILEVLLDIRDLMENKDVQKDMPSVRGSSKGELLPRVPHKSTKKIK